MKIFYLAIALLSFNLISCDNVQHHDCDGYVDSVANNLTKDFCGVPPNMMVQLIKNYKDEVWSKTSDPRAQKYDARYMEISIEQLENFLAYAHKSAHNDSFHLASIRFYYINYPGEKKTNEYLTSHMTGNVFEDYSGCHSIALVPVVGADMRDVNRRDYYSVGHPPASSINAADFVAGQNLIFVPNNCNGSSPMENHNEICPPMVGCITGTLLEAADAL
jgi:hypothetical protein